MEQRYLASVMSKLQGSKKIMKLNSMKTLVLALRNSSGQQVTMSNLCLMKKFRDAQIKTFIKSAVKKKDV